MKGTRSEEGTEPAGDVPPPGSHAGPQARISVVVPCWNQAHFLKECLGSVFAQTWRDWHVLVVDPGSDDAGALDRVLETIDDERVELVRTSPRTPADRGVAAARNAGIASGGELVVILDADDRLPPRALELLGSALTADETLDAVYGAVELFGRREGLLRYEGPSPGQPLLHPTDAPPSSGVLFRRALWERIGGFDTSERLVRRGDFEFWMRAQASGVSLRALPEPTYLRRQTHTSLQLGRVGDDEVREYLREKHGGLFADEASAKAFVADGYRSAAVAWHRKGERAKAMELAWKGWRLAPERGRLKTFGRVAVGRDLERDLKDGELRRRMPLLGYPLASGTGYRPFFIIGVARSGNTLFRRLLTSHSGLHIPPETFVLHECFRKWKLYHRKLAWPDLVQLMFAQFEFHHEYHTIDVWMGPAVNRVAALPQEKRSLAAIIDGFYGYHAEVFGKAEARWGDKTPLNSVEWSTLASIAETFPEAQFLHIYRDAYDVVYSHLSGGFMSSVEDAAGRYAQVIGNTRRFAETFPERTHPVRYEDLLANPGETLQGVCDFLGVPFEETMVSSEAGAGSLGDVPAWFWHQQVNQPINAKNSGKGRSNFSSQAKQVIERLCGDAMRELGYPPATDS